jgi:transposase
MKDLILEIEEALQYNKYSYREIADMFGVDVAFVEKVDGDLDEEGV